MSYDLPRSTVALFGFVVAADADQPDYFTWTRYEQGRLMDGCDVSFESDDEAWAEATQIVRETLEDEDIPAAVWNAMSEGERQNLVQELFAR